MLLVFHTHTHERSTINAALTKTFRGASDTVYMQLDQQFAKNAQTTFASSSRKTVEKRKS